MKTELRPYQKEAVEAFLKAGKGTLKLHSGAGKTIVAAAIIEALTVRKLGLNVEGAFGPPQEGLQFSQFMTAVVVPTIDLVYQTQKVMDEQGIYNVMAMTYAKASKLQGDERFWGVFDLIIFDEVHHLAESGVWQRLLIEAHKAPYTLGLSATPPTDPENVLLRVLPVLYERTLGEGTEEGYAAPVEVRPIPVKLLDEERERYDKLTDMIRVMISRYGAEHYASKPYGKDPITGEVVYGGELTTMRKKLVAMSLAKFDALADLVAAIMDQDAPTRILVWSEYLDALYEAKRVLDRLAEARSDPRISSEVVTGKTPKKERQRLLETWGTEFRILLAARIMEEGADFPTVAHGIIIAGARTTRQNLQRIGRLLRIYRENPKKIAKLYILFASDTIEERLVSIADEVTDA